MGEYFFNILPAVNIISSKSRQILYNHTGHFPLTNILQHTVESRTVKIGSCPSIIFIFIIKLQLRMLLQKVMQQLSLIMDTITFCFSVFRN